MSDANDLIGLPFSAIGCSVDLKGGAIPYFFKPTPKRNRHASVIGVLHRPSDLSVLNHFSVLAAELELVSEIINRPRAVRSHEHTTLDSADDVVEC